MLPLPIDPIIPDLLARLRESRSLVLVADPGAGKTTRIPPAIINNNLLAPDHPNLLLLQPRRVAARAAAARIADENRWTLGREVGYHIRFERRVSRDTRLHVITEGILTRRLLDDPILEGVGCVILDEFHERSLHTDLALALLREVRATVRPDLMLVVMSATLDADPIARFLDNAPIIRSEGRVHPVEITHAGATPRIDLPTRIARIVSDTVEGDTLVFLPGVAEINRTLDAIDSLARSDLLPIPLHGSLPSDDQFAALQPAPNGKRKIVLATNIAETSLTIDGVRTVIDSGLARVASYDPRRGMDRLELKRISRASATQRAGRAGRTAPGRCIRLWSAIEDKSLEPFETPEIKRVDLTATVLALHAWGHADPRAFGWFDAPDERTLASAERLLELLGAITSETAGKITDVGRRMLALPVHPRLARLLLAAADEGMLREGAAIAALLSEKDILRPRERATTTQSNSDLLIRLDILTSRRRDPDVDPIALRQVEKARDELERTAPRSMGVPPMSAHTDDQLLRLPLLAYPDRVCRRRGNDPSAAVMVGGSGVRLAPESSVRQPEFFIALDPRQDERNPAREAIVRIASGIEMQWLLEMFPHEIRRQRTAVYDEQRDRVVARGTIAYRDLILREDTDASVDAETASRVLIEHAAAHLSELLPTDDPWLARVAFLTRAMPERGLPADLESLARQALPTAAAGKRSIADLRTALVPAMKDLLDYPLQRLIDTEAPESIAVPTGNRIRLDYAHNPPVLAVRLQELFGLTQTPRIAAGRVAVRLHLLGPNHRPVQITDDLQSFWKTTYFQVRKDLRVRYPKHSWPDDPLTATPQAKGGRRNQ